MNKKKVLSILLSSLFLVGIVSAVVLTYFGKVTTTIDVNRAVVLSGNGCVDNECNEDLTAFGGETVETSIYTMVSQTSVDVPVEIVSVGLPNDGGIESVTVQYDLIASQPQGTEARIRVTSTQLGISTLSDLNTITFDQNVLSGYVGHVDVLIDINGDGVKDDALVFEYDKVDDGCGNGVPFPTGKMATFGDKGIVDNNAYAWLSSGAAGNCQGDPNYIVGTLADWKSGMSGIDGNTAIVALEFEVDSWIMDSETVMSNLKVNGNAVNDITAQAEKSLPFNFGITFASGAVGEYSIGSEILVK